MRSQLCIPFILLNVIVQVTACAQQPAVKASIATTQVETTKNLPESQTKAPANEQAVIQADATDGRSSAKQVSLITGVYNAGSRYITIAKQGNRICYQGVSMPSGRYAVAVGETTGSLSAEKDYFVADGWKKYGRTVTLSQNGENLSISLDGGSPSEYNFFQKDSREKYSESLTHVTQKPKKVSETAIPSEIAAKP